MTFVAMERTVFAQQFELLLDGYIQDKTDSLIDAYGTHLVPALEPLYDYGQGGKYIRPYMVYLGHLLVGGSMDVYELMDIGLINELIHCFALVHDDIVDAGMTRRHRSCYHRILRKTYEDDHIGDGQAMLVGDLLLSRSMQKLVTVENTKARTIVADMVEKVIVGELLDVHYSILESEVSTESIELKDSLKTADYTFTGPLLFGAQMAGVSDRDGEVLTTFGRQIGVAFQLRDDLLDRLDHDDGKTKFSDIVEGNQTAIWQYIMNKASGSESKRLLSIRGNKVTDSDRVRLRELVHQYDLKIVIAQRINTMLNEAQNTLLSTERNEEAKEYMTAIIDYVRM